MSIRVKIYMQRRIGKGSELYDDVLAGDMVLHGIKNNLDNVGKIADAVRVMHKALRYEENLEASSLQSVDFEKEST